MWSIFVEKVMEINEQDSEVLLFLFGLPYIILENGDWKGREHISMMIDIHAQD